MFKVLNDRDELGPNVLTITHDPKFILKPIEKFASVKQSDDLELSLSIPVIFTKNNDQEVKKEDGTIVHYMLTFTEDGSIYIKSSKDWKWDVDFPGYKIRFVNRASIENFKAMTIKAITSSPEPGTPVESAAKRIENRMSNIADSDMTKEKQDILDLIQKIVLDKDMRSFTI